MATLIQAERQFGSETTTNELDVLEVTPAVPTRISSIVFDMKKATTGFDAVADPAVTATFRAYVQVDGTNYRRVGPEFVYTRDDAENPSVFPGRSDWVVGTPFKVTVQLSQDDGDWDLPYAYVSQAEGRADALGENAQDDAAEAVWDAARASYDAAGSFGEGVTSVQGNVTGSVASIAASGISAASFATDALSDDAVSAAAAAKVGGAVWDQLRASHTTAGSFGEGIASVQGNVTGSVNSVAVGGITATSFAAGAISDDAVSAAAAAKVGGAVWDQLRASHTTAGSFGEGVASVQGNVTGSVASIATGGINAAAFATDALSADAVSAAAAAKVGGAVWDQLRASHTTAGSFGEGVASVQGNVTGSVNSVAVGGITATSFATDALSADAVSAAAAAKVGGAVWDQLRASHTTAGSFGEGVASVQGNVTGSVNSVAADGITAASFAEDAVDGTALAASASQQIADAVWDEDVVAAHGTDDTAGRLLRSLGADIAQRDNNATLAALLAVVDENGATIAHTILDAVLSEGSHDAADSVGLMIRDTHETIKADGPGDVAETLGHVRKLDMAALDSVPFAGSVASRIGAVDSAIAAVDTKVVESAKQVVLIVHVEGGALRVEAAMDRFGTIDLTGETCRAEFFSQDGNLLRTVTEGEFGAKNARGFFGFTWSPHNLTPGKTYQVRVTIGDVTTTKAFKIIGV